MSIADIDPVRTGTDDRLRALFLRPCETKLHLQKWIKVFMGLDIPDAIVDPSSNSTPMDMIYECYSNMRVNLEGFDRVLFYAARDSFKTLSQAILEALALYHLERDIVHLAAILDQSAKAKRYVRGFLGRPYFRDYVVNDSKRETRVVRYRSDAGDVISPGHYDTLSEEEKLPYKEISNEINIVVLDMKSCNGQHSLVLCLDEVDVMDNYAAYKEAKMIPSTRDGKSPLTILTSSRKVSFGLVQKEIDTAAKTGLHIRHWNYLDVTEACPPERHLPAEEKVPVYVSDQDLRAIPGDEFDKLTEEEREKFVKYDAYAGCMKNCSLFPACKGYLATRQTSKSPLLKKISFTISQFKANDVDMVKAQLLCWEPSTHGRIYSRLNPEIHMITAAQMAEKITGEKYDPKLHRTRLIQIMIERGMKFGSGMDFGYSHNFAVPTGAYDGYRMFIFDVISMPELEQAQQVEVCKKRIKILNPSIYPDPENPQTIKFFRRNGFKMRDWIKGPGSVIGGIQAVRTMLAPSFGEPRLFFLRGDPGCELLVERMKLYHFKLDAAGDVTDVPDDREDDECDGLRYLVMNTFSSKGEVNAGKDGGPPVMKPTVTMGSIQEGFMQQALRAAGVDPAGIDQGRLGKSAGGGFIWSI